MKYPQLLCFFLFFTCVKDVDFNQAENITINPAIENSILHFNLTSQDFLDDIDNEITSFQDHAIVSFFENDIVQDNLIRIEFYFTATNSFNRGFSIDVNFYDATDALQQTINSSIPESTTNQVQTNEFIFSYEGADLDAIKTTTRIEASVALIPGSGTTITPTSIGVLDFQSKAISYFEFASEN